MSEVPKCASRRGHKFEGRYSFATSGDLKFDRVSIPGGPEEFERAIRAFQNKTYERDICVRCGFTIERNSAPVSQETPVISAR